MTPPVSSATGAPPLVPAVDDPLGLRFVTLHGHRRAYRMAGSGPVIVLLHGLGCDSSTWLPVMARLAEDHTVIAPDLLGHGASDKPRADYSVGGYANGIRDLLTVLSIDKVTVVGHSFGGGVAMQFAYQFPERTERLALVAPGGLGREVSPLVRAITLPMAGTVLGVLGVRPLRPLVRTGLTAASRSGLGLLRDLDEVADVYDQLCDPRSRAAIRHVTRAVVDWRGQVVTMADRAYLTALLPVCVVWGTGDHVVPTRHSALVERYAPGAEVHLFEDAGHFPHKDHPERFAETLVAFVDGTTPASYHRGRWRALLRRGGPAPTGARQVGQPDLEVVSA